MKLLHSARTNIFLSLVLLTQGCGVFSRGYNDRGELRGVPDRDSFVQTIPYGMTYIPPGTFHMGQADEDITSSKMNLNKQLTISAFFMDETEITNNEYRQFINYYIEDESDFLDDDLEGDFEDDFESTETITEEEVREKYYPDTSVWIKDFSYHLGDPLARYYWEHPAYDDYPVVGVDWIAAKKFCEWRTQYLNTYRDEEGLFKLPDFRLPTEAEWEYAARGGRDMAKYPWGGPYIRNASGCLLANLKPVRGNYFDDGYSYTAPVASFLPNDYGLFDMSGNISEWCLDAFHRASYPFVWDLNPIYADANEPRKIVRGGSWKDIPYYTETGTRTFEYEDTARSYIGFRCVMTYVGRSAGTEFGL